MNVFLLLWAVIASILAAGILLLWRKSVSKTVELTAAVDAAVAKIADLKNQVSTLQAELASVTPDTEVQPEIEKLTAATQ